MKIAKILLPPALVVLNLFLQPVPGIAQRFSSTIIVAHKAQNALGYYAADGSHLATVDVGPNPHEMVLSPDRSLVYITNNGVMRWMDEADGWNTVSIVDVAARKKIGEISTGNYRRPHGIDLDPVSGLIAVTCEKPDQLLIIDPVKRAVIRHFETGGKTAHNVTLDPGAKWAYVSNISTNTVGAVNLSTGAVISIPVGQGPQDCAFSRNGKELFVACSDSITIIDVTAKKVTGKMGIGATRITITPDGNHLITATRPRGMAFIDPATRAVLGKVELPGDPYSISVSSDGKYAFTGAELDNEVYIVSVAERRIVRTVKTVDGARPDPVWDITSP